MEPVDDPPRTVVVDLDDLVDAFDFVISAAPLENRAWISLATGKIRWHSVLVDLPDEDEDAADGAAADEDAADEDGGEIEAPHKYDLDLGRSLALRFARQQMPRDYAAVEDCFRGRGAYARFKDLLQRRRMLEQWYAFEEHSTREALRDWCEANDIQVAEAKQPADKRGWAPALTGLATAITCH